jgi:hypothetical protein
MRDGFARYRTARAMLSWETGLDLADDALEGGFLLLKR